MEPVELAEVFNSIFRERHFSAAHQISIAASRVTDKRCFDLLNSLSFMQIDKGGKNGAVKSFGLPVSDHLSEEDVRFIREMMPSLSDKFLNAYLHDVIVENTQKYSERTSVIDDYLKTINFLVVQGRLRYIGFVLQRVNNCLMIQKKAVQQRQQLRDELANLLENAPTKYQAVNKTIVDISLTDKSLLQGCVDFAKKWIERSSGTAETEAYLSLIACYRKLEDRAAEKETFKALCEVLELRGDEVRHNPMMSQSLYTDCVNYIRTAGINDGNNLARLNTKIMQDNVAIRDLMIPIEVPLDVSDLVEWTKDFLESATAFEALGKLLILLDTRPVTEAFENYTEGTLSQLFSESYMEDGRTVAVASGLGADGTHTKRGLHTFQAISKMVEVEVNCRILPCMQHFVLGNDQLTDFITELVAASPLIELDHREIFVRGFSALFDLDLIAASSILSPMVEYLFRRSIQVQGDAGFNRTEEKIDDAMYLSTMLSHECNQSFWGKTICNEVSMLFNDRAGPNFRNGVAHGLFKTQKLVNESALFCNLYVLKLVCFAAHRSMGEPE